MILVLVDPAVALFSFDHKFIVPKPCIDERINESSCKIPLCGIHIGSRSCAY